MSHSLTDDGTLDTVIRCDDCGHETRFTYDNGYNDGYGDPKVYQDGPEGFWHVPGMTGKFATEQGAENALGEQLYNEFVEDCISDLDTEGCSVCLGDDL